MTAIVNQIPDTIVTDGPTDTTQQQPPQPLITDPKSSQQQQQRPNLDDRGPRLRAPPERLERNEQVVDEMEELMAWHRPAAIRARLDRRKYIILSGVMLVGYIAMGALAAYWFASSSSSSS